MLFSFTALLAMTGLSTAVATVKRAGGTATNLYAYGATDNGASVFYADGLAYFGSPLSNATQTNITFDTTSTSWSISSTSSSVTFNETLYFYIVTTNNTFTQVGFASNSSLPDGAVTEGFKWFGNQVAYAASGGEYEFQFWGVNTTTTGIFGLYWDQSGDVPDSAVPVVLKSTAPSSKSKSKF